MMVPMRLAFRRLQETVSGCFQASQNARFFTAWNSMMNTMNAFLTCNHESIMTHHVKVMEARLELARFLMSWFYRPLPSPLGHSTIYIGNLHHPATRRMSHLNLSALFPWMLFEKPSSMFTLQPFRMCIGFRLTIMISVPVSLHPCMHP